MISDMAEDMKDIRMAMCIWDNLKLEKHMVKAIILGDLQVKYMMVNG